MSPFTTIDDASDPMSDAVAAHENGPTPTTNRTTWKDEAAVVIIYTVLLSLLVLTVPMMLWLTKLSWVAIPGRNGELTLLKPGSFALGVPLSFAALFSWLAGGYARARFARLSSSVLLILSYSFVAIFISVAENVARAGATIDATAGDNDFVLICVALWLLLYGYAVKAFYDEARDRLAKSLDTWLPKFKL